MRATTFSFFSLPALKTMVGFPVLLLASPALSQTPAEIARWGASVVTVFSATNLGTGFHISPAGYVVTNYHVIRGKRDLRIRLRTGEVRFVSAVIQQDEVRDLAVLAVDPTGLGEAVLGDSDGVQPGEDVVAIGSPEALHHSVTKGIISQIRRDRSGVRLLQTQTPLSPGNSGGPLFNARGEVIGIVTMILRGEGTQNLNFAVAVNELREMLGLSVSRPLGIPRGPYIDGRSESLPPPPAPKPTGYVLHLTDGQTVHADSVEETGSLIFVKRPGVSFSYPRASVTRIENREDGTSKPISGTPAAIPPAQQARIDSPPPLASPRTQRAAPNYRIELKNGSEIVADRAWFQDEWLFYERSGFQNKVRIVDVDVLADQELDTKLAVCRSRFREADARIGATAEAARKLLRESGSRYEAALINEAAKELMSMEVNEARRMCDRVVVKWAENKRQLEEAAKKAGR